MMSKATRSASLSSAEEQAIGRKDWGPVEEGFFGIGVILTERHPSGILDSMKDKLIRCAKTGAS